MRTTHFPRPAVFALGVAGIVMIECMIWGTCRASRDRAPSLETGQSLKIMTFNISRVGTDAGVESIRVIQALRPDVALLQEWSVAGDGFRDFVDEAFGVYAEYLRGPGVSGDWNMSNGLVSRWPILSSGSWTDSYVTHRYYDWAVIDIPGDTDLQVVSVHLKAGGLPEDIDTRIDEANEIKALVQANFDDNDYIVVGGDLNTPQRTSDPMSIFQSFLSVNDGTPADRNGDADTNSARSSDYDWIMPNSLLGNLISTLTVGSYQYAGGIVFDSHVFTPLTEVAPVEYDDTHNAALDHCPVMKRYLISGVSPVEVVLNEIMPNPATDYWSTDGSGATTDVYNEYIEIYNRGTVIRDISGWMLKKNGSVIAVIDDTPATRGVPPGGHILVVRDDTWAEAGGPNITCNRSAHTGSWIDLGNSGGYTVSLHDAAGVVQDYVAMPTLSYGNDRPYYRSPAGGDWCYAVSSSERSPVGHAGGVSTYTPTPAPSPTPTPPVGIIPWINEIHYDNDGADVDEGVEIAGAAGTGLDGWSIVGYNGYNGTVYMTENCAGVLPYQQNGYGTLWFPVSGVQNGSPDGLALVDPGNQVIQFLSYEGEMTAVDGPASGMTSVDIVVYEPSTLSVGQSLQLTGNGGSYGDFSWAEPSAQTRGLPNNNQSFQAALVTPTPTPTPIPDAYLDLTILLHGTYNAGDPESSRGVSGDYAVTIELRDSFDGSGVNYTCDNVALDKYGAVEVGPLDLGVITPGNYYIVVSQLNHLAVITAAPLPFSRGVTTVADLSNPVSPDYASSHGTNAMYMESNGIFTLHAGNANTEPGQENYINVLDALVWINANGSTPGSPAWDIRADFDANAMINVLDILLWLHSNGATGYVP